MTHVDESSGPQLGSYRSEQIGGGGLHRKLESTPVYRVFHGRGANQPASDINLTQRSRSYYAVKAEKPRRSIPRNGFRIDDTRGSTRPSFDEELCRSKLVELGDNAVAGCARQAQRRHERGQPNDNAQNGEHHTPRPGEHPRHRFIQKITDRDSRPG